MSARSRRSVGHGMQQRRPSRVGSRSIGPQELGGVGLRPILRGLPGGMWPLVGRMGGVLVVRWTGLASLCIRVVGCRQQ